MSGLVKSPFAAGLRPQDQCRPDPGLWSLFRPHCGRWRLFSPDSDARVLQADSGHGGWLGELCITALGLAAESEAIKDLGMSAPGKM
jgi:hypothetical protein